MAQAGADAPLFHEALRPMAGVGVGLASGSDDDGLSVTLPEDVRVSLDPASPLLRVGAVVLDALIIVFGVMGLGLVFVVLQVVVFATPGGAGHLFAQLAQALMLVLIGALSLGYFFFFEVYFRGQTPGKRAVGLRVVGDDGRDAPVPAVLMRSFARIAELALVLPPVYMLIDRRGRRLGDIVAGTMVVRVRPPEDVPVLRELPSYFDVRDRDFALPSRCLAVLTAGDAVVLDHLGARLASMQPRARARSAAIACEALARRMAYPHPVPPHLAERFLFEVHVALRTQLHQLHPDVW